MKTEEKAKKVQNIATALAAIFGAVGAFFGIFQAQMSANLKNQVTSLQNASQQTIVNVISTLGDDAQAADLAQSGDTVAITEQLINVYQCSRKALHGSHPMSNRRAYDSNPFLGCFCAFPSGLLGPVDHSLCTLCYLTCLFPLAGSIGCSAELFLIYINATYFPSYFFDLLLR